MKILSKDQVIFLQNQLIDKYGGIHGIRDEGLLDAALSTPFQTFGGSDLIRTLLKKHLVLVSDL